MATTGKRVTFVCYVCGSNNVTRDAWARWDVKAQEWVLGDLYDNADCQDCDGETKLVEVELAPVRA
ncbi:hypothetical protein [Sphingomonas sp.]|jgi:predicted RNA-binding Zn-ribbon protein involved in translation (DUF1610 family)|uniref:hypothetical protein n=1 Tax=Sphingomonas sp. TaxID=28214 RepID=UPI002DE717FA|nr:hypothetical protein [Sphingomonas sp.]